MAPNVHPNTKVQVKAEIATKIDSSSPAKTDSPSPKKQAEVPAPVQLQEVAEIIKNEGAIAEESNEDTKSKEGEISKEGPWDTETKDLPLQDNLNIIDEAEIEKERNESVRQNDLGEIIENPAGEDDGIEQKGDDE